MPQLGYIGAPSSTNKAETFKFFAVQASQMWYETIAKAFTPREGVRSYEQIFKAEYTFVGGEEYAGPEKVKVTQITPGTLYRRLCWYYAPFPHELSCPFRPQKIRDPNGDAKWAYPAQFSDAEWQLLQERNKKFPPKIVPSTNGLNRQIPEPMCVAEFEIKNMKCSTCCCKEGVSLGGVNSREIISNHPNCGLWFSLYTDTTVRMVASLFRAAKLGLNAVPCLKPLCCAKQDQYGRCTEKRVCTETDIG